MLTRRQLEVLARREGIPLGAVERDYVQYLFLRQLDFEPLLFKGGTCLRIALGSPRYSEDLDFSTAAERPSVLEALVHATAGLGDYGLRGELVEQGGRQGCSAVLRFEGPLYDGKPASRGKIRLEVSLRKERLMQETVFVPRTPYADTPQLVLRILRKDLLFAEKIRALLIRAKPRDLFDVHYLFAHEVSTTLGEINERLALYGVSLSRELVERALAGVRENWGRDLGALLGQVPPVDPIVEETRSKFVALLTGE